MALSVCIETPNTSSNSLLCFFICLESLFVFIFYCLVSFVKVQNFDKGAFYLAPENFSIILDGMVGDESSFNNPVSALLKSDCKIN